MTNFDGPTLRAVRESLGVPLRRIAKQSGMSHGHLSKVERGEYGRPVTPAIMAAYQRVTGVDLHWAAKTAAERTEGPTARRLRSWRPGELTDLRRRAYNAALGALTIGGQLGEPYGRLLDSAGRPLTPAPPEPSDVHQLAQITDLVTALEIRYGGGLVSKLAKHLLRWTTPMLDSISMSDHVSRRLHATVGALAHRVAWSAFDVAAHESARSLFRFALFTAGRSGDPDLRAHILGDAAAQHNHLGYHQDALEVARLAEGDERLSPAVRAVLHGVKARAYAALGEADNCRRAIDLAEHAHSQPQHGEVPDWVGTLGRPAHLYALTGHALATMALRIGGEAHHTEAVKRLDQAIDGHGPVDRSRAVALCAARLATLHINIGDHQHAEQWTRYTLDSLASIRSARLDRALAAIRATAAHHPDQAAMGDLIAQLDAASTEEGDRP